MPIYEYRCRNGHDFEVFQSMSDPAVQICEVCGEPVERIFSPVAVHYKGSGFYTTDYARKGAAKSGDGEGGQKQGDGESKKGEGDSAKGNGDSAKGRSSSDSKSDSKSKTTASSGGSGTD